MKKIKNRSIQYNYQNNFITAIRFILIEINSLIEKLLLFKKLAVIIHFCIPHV
ncbi:MAG: hypothetical protein K0R77_208 [Chryseobacterium sp.]|jgi:hypothetical protein|nr:hypothetical protein [Chryseobacterium sp.]